MSTLILYSKGSREEIYRIQPDVKKDWCAVIQVYLNRLNRKPMYAIHFDKNNPKAYFVLPYIKSGERQEQDFRILEGDKETELIFKEKIHLYTHFQTVTIKGDECWWGDFCILRGTINAGSIGQKGVLMEIRHPPTLTRLEGVQTEQQVAQVTASLTKFIRTIADKQIKNYGAKIFDTNDSVMRAAYYIRLLLQYECFLKPENEAGSSSTTVTVDT